MADTATLDDCLQRVATARTEALAMIEAGQLDEVQAQFLTRKGTFRELQQLLGKLPGDDRPAYGKQFHEAKSTVEQALAAAREGSGPAKAAGPRFDFLPGIEPPCGARHPLIQTIGEITDLFARMGFTPAEGPEIEDVFHNFIALNIPEDHPARDPRDNFYIREDLLVRSQTSTVQIRVMGQQEPPVRVISIGRVYRPDDIDATHYPMFHQVEGLYVDEGVTMADLKTVLSLFSND